MNDLDDSRRSEEDGDVAADLVAIDASFGACMDMEMPARDADERERYLECLWRGDNGPAS